MLVKFEKKYYGSSIIVYQFRSSIDLLTKLSFPIIWTGTRILHVRIARATKMVGLSLCARRLAQQAGAYPGFYSMKD